MVQTFLAADARRQWVAASSAGPSAEGGALPSQFFYETGDAPLRPQQQHPSATSASSGLGRGGGATQSSPAAVLSPAAPPLLGGGAAANGGIASDAANAVPSAHALPSTLSVPAPDVSMCTFIHNNRYDVFLHPDSAAALTKCSFLGAGHAAVYASTNSSPFVRDCAFFDCGNAAIVLNTMAMDGAALGRGGVSQSEPAGHVSCGAEVAKCRIYGGRVGILALSPKGSAVRIIGCDVVRCAAVGLAFVCSEAQEEAERSHVWALRRRARGAERESLAGAAQSRTKANAARQANRENEHQQLQQQAAALPPTPAGGAEDGGVGDGGKGAAESQPPLVASIANAAESSATSNIPSSAALSSSSGRQISRHIPGSSATISPQAVLASYGPSGTAPMASAVNVVSCAFGIVFEGKACSPIIADSDVRQSMEGAGAVVRPDADPLLRNVSLRWGRKEGIAFDHGARGTLDGCSLQRNHIGARLKGPSGAGLSASAYESLAAAALAASPNQQQPGASSSSTNVGPGLSSLRAAASALASATSESSAPLSSAPFAQLAADTYSLSLASRNAPIPPKPLLINVGVVDSLSSGIIIEGGAHAQLLRGLLYDNCGGGPAVTAHADARGVMAECVVCAPVAGSGEGAGKLSLSSLPSSVSAFAASASSPFLSLSDHSNITIADSNEFRRGVSPSYRGLTRAMRDSDGTAAAAADESMCALQRQFFSESLRELYEWGNGYLGSMALGHMGYPSAMALLVAAGVTSALPSQRIAASPTVPMLNSAGFPSLLHEGGRGEVPDLGRRKRPKAEDGGTRLIFRLFTCDVVEETLSYLSDAVRWSARMGALHRDEAKSALTVPALPSLAPAEAPPQPHVAASQLERHPFFAASLARLLAMGPLPLPFSSAGLPPTDSDAAASEAYCGPFWSPSSDGSADGGHAGGGATLASAPIACKAARREWVRQRVMRALALAQSGADRLAFGLNQWANGRGGGDGIRTAMEVPAFTPLTLADDGAESSSAQPTIQEMVAGPPAQSGYEPCVLRLLSAALDEALVRYRSFHAQPFIHYVAFAASNAAGAAATVPSAIGRGLTTLGAGGMGSSSPSAKGVRVSADGGPGSPSPDDLRSAIAAEFLLLNPPTARGRPPCSAAAALAAPADNREAPPAAGPPLQPAQSWLSADGRIALKRVLSHIDAQRHAFATRGVGGKASACAVGRSADGYADMGYSFEQPPTLASCNCKAERLGETALLLGGVGPHLAKPVDECRPDSAGVAADCGPYGARGVRPDLLPRAVPLPEALTAAPAVGHASERHEGQPRPASATEERRMRVQRVLGMMKTRGRPLPRIGGSSVTGKHSERAALGGAVLDGGGRNFSATIAMEADTSPFEILAAPIPLLPRLPLAGRFERPYPRGRVHALASRREEGGEGGGAPPARSQRSNGLPTLLPSQLLSAVSADDSLPGGGAIAPALNLYHQHAHGGALPPAAAARPFSDGLRRAVAQLSRETSPFYSGQILSAFAAADRRAMERLHVTDVARLVEELCIAYRHRPRQTPKRGGAAVFTAAAAGTANNEEDEGGEYDHFAAEEAKEVARRAAEEERGGVGGVSPSFVAFGEDEAGDEGQEPPPLPSAFAPINTDAAEPNADGTRDPSDAFADSDGVSLLGADNEASLAVLSVVGGAAVFSPSQLLVLSPVASWAARVAREAFLASGIDVASGGMTFAEFAAFVRAGDSPMTPLFTEHFSWEPTRLTGDQIANSPR